MANLEEKPILSCTAMHMKEPNSIRRCGDGDTKRRVVVALAGTPDFKRERSLAHSRVKMERRGGKGRAARLLRFTVLDSAVAGAVESSV